jgi:hypothetical protein
MKKITILIILILSFFNISFSNYPFLKLFIVFKKNPSITIEKTLQKKFFVTQSIKKLYYYVWMFKTKKQRNVCLLNLLNNSNVKWITCNRHNLPLKIISDQPVLKLDEHHFVSKKIKLTHKSKIINPKDQLHITALPNPSYGSHVFFRFTTTISGILIVNIFNQDGTLLTKLSKHGKGMIDIDWNLSNVSPNIYFYKCKFISSHLQYILYSKYKEIFVYKKYS